jgi:hypothetical protein
VEYQDCFFPTASALEHPTTTTPTPAHSGSAAKALTRQVGDEWRIGEEVSGVVEELGHDFVVLRLRSATAGTMQLRGYLCGRKRSGHRYQVGEELRRLQIFEVGVSAVQVVAERPQGGSWCRPKREE